MWNAEKKNILVFLTERCKELEQLRAELADGVAHRTAPDIEGLQDLVAKLSRIREQLGRCLQLRDQLSLARMNGESLEAVIQEGIGEIEAARSAHFATVSSDAAAKADYISAAIAALGLLRDDLKGFTATPPAND